VGAFLDSRSTAEPPARRCRDGASRRAERSTHGTGGLLGAGVLSQGVPDDAGGPTCPQCDAELYERHCKYVCPQHGVIMDCADLFYFH
jgi:hypothetical protein